MLIKRQWIHHEQMDVWRDAKQNRHWVLLMEECYVSSSQFCEEKDSNTAKEAGDSAQANGNLEGNRSITQSSRSSPFGNGFKDVKIEDSSFQSFSSSETEEELKNQSPISNFHVLGNCSMENLQATHDPSNIAKCLLPRGLVNSGNTCFLNASLQALLSCSPFVQLLQDLRIRDVPKFGFPTLTACAEFISNFEMPVSSACKNLLSRLGELLLLLCLKLFYKNLLQMSLMGYQEGQDSCDCCRRMSTDLKDQEDQPASALQQSYCQDSEVAISVTD